MNNQGTSQNI